MSVRISIPAFGLLLATAALAEANDEPRPKSSLADDAKVEKILARFANEPSIRDVQVAAIKYYNVSPEQIRALRSRARAKAFMPGFTAGLNNSLAAYNRTMWDAAFGNTGVFRDGQLRTDDKQNSDFLGWNVSASWSLDRAIFNAEELDVMSLIGIQDGIQREVTTLYYVRRRLQIEQILNPPTAVDVRLSNQLRLEELTGLLDAYTGGYFSKETKARSGRAASGAVDR